MNVADRFANAIKIKKYLEEADVSNLAKTLGMTDQMINEIPTVQEFMDILQVRLADWVKNEQEMENINER